MSVVPDREEKAKTERLLKESLTHVVFGHTHDKGPMHENKYWYVQRFKKELIWLK